jgi:SAM-dependent methyltransferase
LALPCSDASFDAVVAFEIIEHLDQPDAFLRELRRALAPSGLLLISTPNRLYYTDDRGEVNPFHSREYSYREFDDLLRDAFPHRRLLLQNHVGGLLVADTAHTKDAGDLAAAAVELHASDRKTTAAEEERAAYFMVALCSQQPLPEAPPLLYLPSTGNVLRERESHIRQLEAQLAEFLKEKTEHIRQLEAQLAEAQRERDEARASFTELERQYSGFAAQLEERTRWAQELDRTVRERDHRIVELQAEQEEKIQWARSLEADVEKARAALRKLQDEFAARTAWALSLKAELDDRIHDLQLVYGSRWYRIGKNLRVSPVPASDHSADGQ